MINMEDELREAFARQTFARPDPMDLAERVINRGRAVRRRRLVAIATSGVLAVALLVTVALVRLPNGESGLDAIGAGAEPSELQTGSPVRLAVFGFRSVRLPDGTEQVINNDAEESVTQVVQTSGGWVVQSSSRVRELPAITLVRADEPATRLSDAAVSVAANATGDRVAVESQGDDGQWVDVYDVTSGKPVASTPLPGDTAEAPVVVGWVGSLVVFSAGNPDAGPVASDVWDPARGLYSSSMSGERMLLGPADQPGQLLTLDVDTDFPDACLSWVDVAKAFTVVTRKCDTGMRFGDRPPWVSPDGSHLVTVGSGGKVAAVDVRTMASVPLGLPERSPPIAVGWEDPATALFRLPDSVVRCRLDGSPCELAPMPEVDGAEPVGFVNQK